MYTLLLMTAMSSSPQTAEFNGFFRDLFSFGGCKGTSCQGSCYGSCHGASSGCYGSSSSSCNGFGSRMRAFFSGSSCYGSCSGRSAGCAGSCYGSCQGSGYGCAGGFAPIPMGPGEYAPLPAGASSPGFDYMPATPVPAVPQSVPDSRQRISLTGPAAGDRATVVVRLPADAKLYAEGRPLTLTSAERTFVTPPLQTGPNYSYTFRAEYLREGETIARSKTVAVKPGVVVTVEFTEGVAKADPPRKPDPVPTKPTAVPKVPSLPTTGDRARITVKLPPGATLYVDGKKNERSEPVREFNTPPLPAGQEFAYLMKAELMRDGRPESTTTKVSFRAGEIVTVDLTAPAK